MRVEKFIDDFPVQEKMKAKVMNFKGGDFRLLRSA